MNDYDSIKNDFLRILAKYNLKESDRKIQEVYQEYINKCIQFQEYVIGNLDTFKKAACMMSAILKCRIVENQKENDKMAVYIAFSLIEKPSYYVGENYDKEFPLSPISLEQLKSNSYLWENIYKYTLQSIQYYRYKKEETPVKYADLEEINVLSTAENFELIYHAALLTQKPVKYYEMPIEIEKGRKKASSTNSKVKNILQR